MTKTEELEIKCMQGLIDSSKLTVLVVDDALCSSAEAQMTLGTVLFPSPGAEIGNFTHAVIQNPRRRWWAFWRPRTIVIKLSEPANDQK